MSSLCFFFSELLTVEWREEGSETPEGVLKCLRAWCALRVCVCLLQCACVCRVV